MKSVCSCRRQWLGWVGVSAVGVVLGLSGCGEGGGDVKALTPVEIGTATSCELDGMLLVDYPGPKAQIFYEGASDPVFTCDTVEMFNMLLRPEQVRKVAAVYVQDMGQADWEQPKGHWMEARSGYFVLGSKRNGSMGPTIASFSQAPDAEKFIAQWGGKVLRYADVTPDMVDLSGGALHDTRM